MKPRRSVIPTPSRSRSASSAGGPVPVPDVAEMSRAFTEALKSNDPAQHRTSISRPASRQSDVFRAAPRPFQLGDNVRIESLGFEGALRYLGDIDGKPGLWAGVELSGGFAGKGKNDGSVAGKRYFSCPPSCGVFVATTKLSPPTVGPGAYELKVATNNIDRSHNTVRTHNPLHILRRTRHSRSDTRSTRQDTRSCKDAHCNANSAYQQAYRGLSSLQIRFNDRKATQYARCFYPIAAIPRARQPFTSSSFPRFDESVDFLSNPTARLPIHNTKA
ncbi:hypothetical protein MKEN_00661900 [Mycena kentingensis (nom. inval.)]|nr:hypothetical protein MKEN_00661900 [Mycena kentingensis (nom. inval.)]